jgi:glycosyltransferase involved in cell wall biosynthesis
MSSSPRILYLVYWGAQEPLGQSLVLPAVKQLSALGARITLVTFEKPADLARRDVLADTRKELEERGVRWLPLRYHKNPKVPATAFDIAQGIARGLVERLRERPDLIHARTFIGGAIGLTLARLIRVPWIYHNEGFYPDEQVDGGVWRAGSRPHRIAKGLEQRLYEGADGVIALSHRAREQIESSASARRRTRPTIVVPSCVDLDRFRRAIPGVARSEHGARLVYSGAIGHRYRFGDAARFAAIYFREHGGGHLRVLSRAEPSFVGSLVEPSGLAPADWSLDSVAHAAMPDELTAQDAGLSFLTQGISEHGGSPTKVGEYWAMGLPVVTTANVSDTDAIIRRERVGVVVDRHTDEDYRSAACALKVLLGDPDLALRCRAAAQSHYALGPACERQMALYQALVSPTGESDCPTTASTNASHARTPIRTSTHG